MSDFYIVCGGPLLAEYCKIEVDDDRFAYLQRKDIRRQLLSATPAPPGTLNLAAYAFIARKLLRNPTGMKRISSLTWRIPVSQL